MQTYELQTLLRPDECHFCFNRTRVQVVVWPSDRRYPLCDFDLKLVRAYFQRFHCFPKVRPV